MGWGLRAAAFTLRHSARPRSSRAGPTPSPQHSEVMLLPGVMHASVSTHRRAPPPPQPTPHLLLARPLARAPALPLPNGPLCSCASITPRVRGSHICAHTCSLPAGAPLGIPKFCLRMPGLPRMAGAILLPPTRTPSRATRHWQARAPSPRHGPLHARRLRGCMHTRPRMDLQHTNCWEGEGKKNPTDSAERGGGGERERKRENDRLQSPLSA